MPPAVAVQEASGGSGHERVLAGARDEENMREDVAGRGPASEDVPSGSPLSQETPFKHERPALELDER